MVLPVGAEREVTSPPVVKHFTTKPLPPRDLRIEDNRMVFSGSLTKTVRYGEMTVRILIVTIHVLGYSSYRVKYRSVEEGSRAEEILVRAEEEDANTVTLDLQVRWEGVKPR